MSTAVPRGGPTPRKVLACAIGCRARRRSRPPGALDRPTPRAEAGPWRETRRECGRATPVLSARLRLATVRYGREPSDSAAIRAVPSRKAHSGIVTTVRGRAPASGKQRSALTSSILTSGSRTGRHLPGLVATFQPIHTWPHAWPDCNHVRIRSRGGGSLVRLSISRNRSRANATLLAASPTLNCKASRVALTTRRARARSWRAGRRSWHRWPLRY